jgi:Glycosyl hydrolase family 57
MKTFQLFSFFHLNLAYSAIEEEQRPAVIQRCYWPLLNLAEKHNLPFSIELSAYTLEQIAAIDPAWIEKFKWLISYGRCELIGCGYAQVIGPLVPADMNAANLRIGMQVYESILGLRPTVALVNEQAYSAGLVELYLEAGYQAIIMEWNNPASGHPEWNSEWRYLPQKALGPRGEAIPLIWNKSIAFQKFQRYVHGEIELDEYLSYIYSHASSSVRAFPVYGNDVEVFDYRPGRYMTEEPLHGEGEWARIEKLYTSLAADAGGELIKTSEVLNLMGETQAGHSLRLESAAQPIPVKKQEKYNVLRWAVTGRDDVFINTRCRQIFEALKDSSDATDEDWRELSYLYSSDFRTHITEKRWNIFLHRLQSMHERWVNTAAFTEPASTSFLHSTASSYTVEKKGHYWVITGRNIEVSLNAHRGLALEALTDKKINKAICGTLHHGYFDDIQWGADFYSGHLVFQSPGRHKVTDLVAVEPTWEERNGIVTFNANIKTSMGLIEKQWLIDDAHQTLSLSYKLHWEEAVIGSLRLGHVTLFPDSFDAASLVFKTHNGGRDLESFNFGNVNIDHGEAVSFLISGKQALGMTEGYVEFSDGQTCLSIQSDPQQATVVGMLTHQLADEKKFTRLSLSKRELDDTSRSSIIKNQNFEFKFRIFEKSV